MPVLNPEHPFAISDLSMGLGLFCGWRKVHVRRVCGCEVHRELCVCVVALVAGTSADLVAAAAAISLLLLHNL